MHDFVAGRPLILTDDPKSPNLVKLIPSIEFNFWLKIFSSVWHHKLKDFMMSACTWNPFSGTSRTVNSIPDEILYWSSTSVPFETPVVNTLHSEITDSLLLIRSNSQLFSSVPQVTRIISLRYSIHRVHCETTCQSEGQNDEFHFEIKN